MKQWFSYFKIMLVIGLLHVPLLQAVNSQELDTYVQLIKDINQALVDEVIDPAVIVQEHDIISLVELFEEIKFQLPVAELEVVQTCINHIRSELLRSKAPRIGATAERHAVNIDPRFIDQRDSYLRDLLVTGSLVAPGFSASLGFIPSTGGTVTGDIILASGSGLVLNTPDNSGSVKLLAPAHTELNANYVLELPVDNGTPGQALTTDGGNPAQLVWSSAIATTSGIQSINLLTAPAQTLTNGSAGAEPNWTTSAPATQILNIPQASTA